MYYCVTYIDVVKGDCLNINIANTHATLELRIAQEKKARSKTLT